MTVEELKHHDAQMAKLRAEFTAQYATERRWQIDHGWNLKRIQKAEIEAWKVFLEDRTWG